MLMFQQKPQTSLDAAQINTSSQHLIKSNEPQKFNDLFVQFFNPPQQRCFGCNLQPYLKQSNIIDKPPQIFYLDQQFGPRIEEFKVSVNNTLICHVKMKKQMICLFCDREKKTLLQEISYLKKQLADLYHSKEYQRCKYEEMLKKHRQSLQSQNKNNSDLQKSLSLQSEYIEFLKLQIIRLTSPFIMPQNLPNSQNLNGQKVQETQDLSSNTDKKSLVFLTITSLIPHPSHKNNSSFQILTNNILKKTSEGTTWDNFILKQQINFDKVYSLKFFIIKSIKFQIHLGVCTDRVFNQFNTKKNDNCITGMLDKGTIWMNGEEWSNLDVKGIMEGSVVEIEVDRIHGKVKWFKQISNEAETELMGAVDIPQHLEFKNLFFFVTMFKFKECVRVINDFALKQ